MLGRASIVLGLLLCIGPVATDGAEESVRAEDHVILRSGRVMAGRVIKQERVHGKMLLVVDSPFGEWRIPAHEVASRKEHDQSAAGVFRPRRLRVVRIVGLVERRQPRSERWFPVRWVDSYGQPVSNQSNALIRPGDTIRTGADGTLDFQPSKHVWVRVGKASEIQIPEVDSEPAASLEVKAGSATVDVRGRPGGSTFRVRTPVTTLSIADGAVRIGRSGALVLRGKVEGKAKPAPPAERRRYATVARAPRLPPGDMVYVPAGVYRLGGPPAGGAARAEFEESLRDPQGNVVMSKAFEHTIAKPYLLDRFEVTNAQYSAFCSAMNVRLPPSLRDDDATAPSPQQPVYGITYSDAVRFAQWVGRTLPSEVQWEAAARGPRGLKFPWGQRSRKAHDRLFVARWTPGSSPDGLNYTRLPETREATLDVSPCGVRGMVTSVPEFVVGKLWEAPFGDQARPHKQSGLVRSSRDRVFQVIRGAWGQAACRHFYEVLPPAQALDEPPPREIGFRCAHQLRD